MKKITEVVLMLCIAMMCTTSFEAQGQNRHHGGGSSHAPRTEHRAQSGHSEPRTKMSAPRNNSHGSGQVSRSQGSQISRSHGSQISRNPGSSASRSHGTPQVNRNHNGSHSGSVARNNSITRNDRPAQRPNVSRAPKSHGDVNRSRSDMTRAPRPGSGHGSSHGSAIARNHNPRPTAVHHDPRPARRGPAYSRPYLEPRHRPMPSHHYGNHYFGHRIHSLPLGYRLMRIGYRDYYYCDGIYYRPYLGGGYYVCRPPLGTRIAAALFDMAMTTIAINTIRNEIERAQLAAELSSIYASRNADYVVRTSDDYYNANLLAQAGQDYYYQDGVFYTLKNGEYCVIEAPIGALVESIPDDYDEIELGGKTYYQVEDTLYKPTIINGKLHFEVACNL